MSKTDLIKEVETLIADVDKSHRYSMSKIYGLYNRVFEVNEAPQSCASCLIRKVKELRDWYSDAKEKYAEMPAEGEIGNSSDNEEVGGHEEALPKKRVKKQKKEKA